MGDEEKSALTRLYEGLRDEVNNIRDDVSTLNAHMLWGFALIFTGFALPVGVAIIVAVFKM